jgi:MFS family permease
MNPPSPSFTAKRGQILLMVMGLCLLAHFNRISMSVAGTERIMPEYGIGPTRMGWVYSALLIVYALSMTPGGLVLDRIGPRRALMVVGFSSAAFAALTGVAGWLSPDGNSLWLSLLFVRGSMGMLTAPLHPSSARMVGNWFPRAQQTLANGLVTGAAIIGVAVTYRGFGVLIERAGWKAAFVISAAVTAGCTLVWARAASDHPSPGPAGSTLEAGGPGPARAPAGLWKRLLMNRSLLLLTLSYAAVGYFQFMFMYWMQYYFNSELHLSGSTSRTYASIPQLAMALTMPLGGWLADVLARKTTVRRGRSITAAAGMILSAGLLELGTLAKDPIWIVAWFTLALGALGAAEGSFWATATDIGGRAGGTAAAICNTGGNVGGLLAPVVTPWVSLHWGWAWGLSLSGLFGLLGGLCWWGIDPRSADGDSPAPAGKHEPP